MIEEGEQKHNGGVDPSETEEYREGGRPKEIFSKVEMLKKLRLDVPQVTLLAYELKKAGLPLPDGILTTEELICQLS